MDGVDHLRFGELPMPIKEMLSIGSSIELSGFD
jgi:hypothetical protein